MGVRTEPVTDQSRVPRVGVPPSADREVGRSALGLLLCRQHAGQL